MAAARNPLQLIREAKQIAKDYGLRIAECKDGDSTVYVIYRRLPDDRDARIGKRSSPDGLRRYVARLANFH